MIWDISRIIAYAIQSLLLVYLAIDDYENNRKSDIVWAALAAQSIAVLALLSLDVGSIVVWVEARYILTLPAAAAAVSVAWYASRRIVRQIPRRGDDE